MEKTMRTKFIASAALGVSLPMFAVAEAPSVAVDIAPLHSLVSQVMKGVEEPALLIPAEASPHSYSLRPSQAKALSEADVVFWMGESLTPWLEKAINNVADSSQKVEMLELASTTKYEFREGATFEGHDHHEEDGHHDEHDKHEEHNHEEHHHEKNQSHNEHTDHHDEKHHDEHEEHSFLERVMAFFGSDHDSHEHAEEHQHDHHEEHGHEDEHDHHDHEGADPHAWLDPENAKAWIVEIEKTLSKQDPKNAATYAKNADKATANLDKLILETRSQVEALGELKYIVFHDAYQYFEKRFDISAAGSISLGDAEDPSPARIAEIRNTVKTLGVNCVFTEPQYNAGLVENVFEGSTISAIGVMDPLGASIEEGSQHYALLIQGMVKSLSQCNK
jgi:zinc transport system substrate-binding protein